MSDWADHATNELIRLHQRDRGWGYRDEGEPATEPTVLASLALLSLEVPKAKQLAEESAKWLASIQRADGAVGPSATQSEPAWPTPYALLLWTCLGIEIHAARRAQKWLLTNEGSTFTKSSTNPLGHDTSIPGWPWVMGTHSWVEPTALSILALRRAGEPRHLRVQQGLAMIRDRAIPDGGWNFGNNLAFGAALRPKPGPTALALLALVGTQDRDAIVDKALVYLTQQLTQVRAAQSLGLGLMALSAWNARPDAASDWLEQSSRRLSGRTDRPASLAYLLLGSSNRSLAVLGVHDGGT